MITKRKIVRQPTLPELYKQNHGKSDLQMFGLT